MPFHVEPCCAKGVQQRANISHVFTPARFTAQSDTIVLVRFVSQCICPFLDILIGRLVRHLKPFLVKKVLPIHQHRTFSVERQSVQFSLRGKAVSDRLKDIVHVVIGRNIVHRLQEPLFAENRSFVQPDKKKIELAAPGRCVSGYFCTQVVFLEDDPVQFNRRVVRLKLFGELFAAQSYQGY